MQLTILDGVAAAERGVAAEEGPGRRLMPRLVDRVLEGGASWVCSPSYVVTMSLGLVGERPTCLRTPQPAVVHL